MENPDLQGILGIVPTPFTSKEEVDEDGLAHLVRHCRASGLHAAVVLGSNGEFPYLNCEEKIRVIRAAAKAAEGKLPVVAGVSALSTRESVELAGVAKDAGCAAVLSALPLYFNLDLAAVKAHYETLAAEAGLPVIFYYYPDVTGLSLAPDEIAEIAAIKGIHGAKITVINRQFLKKIVRLTRTQLWAVFAGSTFLLRWVLEMGGAGVICPLPLIAPADTMAAYKAYQQGKKDEARKLQDKLLGAIPLFTGLDLPSAMAAPFFKAMIAKPYSGSPDRPASTVAMVKEALRLQGHPITAVTRRPCPPLSKKHAELVRKTLKAQGWL